MTSPAVFRLLLATAWFAGHIWASDAMAAEPTPAAPASPLSVFTPTPEAPAAPLAALSATPAPASAAEALRSADPFRAPEPGPHETWVPPQFDQGAAPPPAEGKATKTPIPESERVRQYKPGGILLSTSLSGAGATDSGATADVVFLWYIGRIVSFEKPDPTTPIHRRRLDWIDPLGAILLGPDFKLSLAGSDPEQPTLAIGVFAPFILQINPSTRSVAPPTTNSYRSKGTIPIPMAAAYLVTTQHVGSADVTFGAYGGSLSRLFSYLTTNPFYLGVDPYLGHALGYAHVSDKVGVGVFGGLNTRRPQTKVNLKLELLAPVPHPQSPILLHVRVTRFLPFDFALMAYNWKKRQIPDWALLGMYDYRVTMFPTR